MRGLGNEIYDVQWEIPYHMTQYKELERFLEKKAGEGYMIEGFTPFFQNGYFSYLSPDTYHFCVDIYPQRITEEVLKSDVFHQYLDACKAKGWTPKTYYKNLVIFYAQQEQRPVELLGDRSQAYELLGKTALRTEGRQLWVLFLLNAVLSAYIVPSTFMSIRNNVESGASFYPSSIYIVGFWGVAVFVFLSRLKRHMDIRKALREGTELPRKGMHTTYPIYCILLPAAFSLSAILLFITEQAFVLAGVGVILLLLFLVLGFPLRSRVMELAERIPVAVGYEKGIALLALCNVASTFVLLGLYYWLL